MTRCDQIIPLFESMVGNFKQASAYKTQSKNLSDRLDKLVLFIFQNLKDPQKIEKMAGFPQEAEREHDLAWMEVYLRKNSNTEMEKLISSKRPLSYAKLGGNLTLQNTLEPKNQTYRHVGGKINFQR